MQNIINIEVDKLKKDANLKRKEYEKKVDEKTNKINALLTDLENSKTEVSLHIDDKSNLENHNCTLCEKMAEVDIELKTYETNVGDLQ